MAKKPTNKKVGKKSAATARVAKPATRAKASPQLNKMRLAEDINYYEEESKPDYTRRSKPSKTFPRGIPLKNLEPKKGGKYYVSADDSIVMTKKEYEEAAYNTKAIPLYIPIHEKRKGRIRIVGYRNSITHHRVTNYYMKKYYNPYFRLGDEPLEDEELEQRRVTYNMAMDEVERDARARKYDLIDSFTLVHPEFIKKEKNGKERIMVNAIIRDAEFQSLVLELSSLHVNAMGATKANITLIDYAMGSSYDEKRIAKEQKLIKELLAKNPRYAEVLELLGRRKPGDTHVPGTSDRDYIKNEVRPYYMEKRGIANPVDFEE